MDIITRKCKTNTFHSLPEYHNRNMGRLFTNDCNANLDTFLTINVNVYFLSALTHVIELTCM